jgi:hypothetical protein
VEPLLAVTVASSPLERKCGRRGGQGQRAETQDQVFHRSAETPRPEISASGTDYGDLYDERPSSRTVRYIIRALQRQTTGADESVHAQII